MYIKSINPIHTPSSSPFTLPPPTGTPPQTILISESCLRLLIPKSMFKSVSPYIPAVIMLYFGQFNLFAYLLLTSAIHFEP
jgi:hypothetical protein